MAVRFAHNRVLVLTIVLFARQVAACSSQGRGGDSDRSTSADDNSASSGNDTSSLPTNRNTRADAGTNAVLDAGKTHVDTDMAGQQPTGRGLAPDAATPVDMTSPADSGAFHDDSSAPGVNDFGAKGPFEDTKMFPETGPNGTYTLFRPDTSLGRNGFKHPIGAWGNGLVTTPDQYEQLLTFIASHGFVIIACPDIQAEEPCLSAGLEWLVEQNAGSGPLADKLDTSKEFSIGFSWGGGAAIDVSTRPNMKAAISLHGMPPRNDPWGSMHAPLVLFSSTGDEIVPADGFVMDNYNSSQVQTFFAILQDPEVRHMYVMDEDSSSCLTGAPELLGLGPCMSAKEERAPIIAWLRYWIYGDQDGRSYYFGDDCKLCSGRWTAQRKNWN